MEIFRIGSWQRLEGRKSGQLSGGEQQMLLWRGH